MMKKYLLTAMVLANTMFAYEVGETIDNEISNKLGLIDEKVYIVDFFASWCASCKIELPLISKLNNKIDKSKYKIVGVNSDQDIKKGKNFVQKLNLNFDIVYDNNNEIISKFAPIGVPAIYYIKDKKVQKVIFGAVHNIDTKILNDLERLGE